MSEAKKLSHESMNDVGLKVLASSVLNSTNEEIIDRAVLAEARRLAISHAGQKINYIYNGDQGYSVKVPDPQLEKCDDCGSDRHWELRDVVSYCQEDTTFYFKCINILAIDGEDFECGGSSLSIGGET